ncbi:MAG: NUDIX hydrolase [Burkholderiales bacterium]|nr:NUDIX hydrolase [Burkholderiales bacterium]
MSIERWSPRVTVAAIVEAGGRYLLVEEQTPAGLRLNNPAGHLEQGESPLEGVVRETLEETARILVPQWLVGIYLTRMPPMGGAGAGAKDDVTFLRFAYTGTVGEPLPGRALDTGIVRTVWLTIDEVRQSADRHRSPLVLRCVEDHAAGVRHPLDVVAVHGSLQQP